MKIAIHNSSTGFHPRWIKYCILNKLAYKIVDCYANNIIEELRDCDALMWHYHQSNLKDNIIAKQILFALEHTGFIVFPNFKTSWHFDDKVAQKYLFERIKAPFVPSYVFFNKRDAIEWVNKASFPKVFKLRGGAGSQNVKLIYNANQALRIVNRAFRKGFSKYDAWGSLKERGYQFLKGKGSLKEIVKGVVRLFYSPQFARLGAKEFGYVYFQDFIPHNDSDIRVIVIDGKAVGLKRYVRDNDFRASGSGSFAWSRELFDESCIKISFSIAAKLNLQVGAFDFVFDEKDNPLIVEVSYGFTPIVYDSCPGYWDESLNWHEGLTTKEDWMVELVIKQIKSVVK